MLAKIKFTQVDSAYGRLKNEILQGVLPPGYQAPEPDIANRLGMSRTPVREALIRLEAEGLVDLVPRRGARVVAISRKDICEIFEILAALEALAAGAAAGVEAEQLPLDDIGRVLSESGSALASSDIGAWANLDDAFHRLIAGLCGNDRLEAEIAGFLDQVYRANTVLLRLNKAPAANVDDHRKIVEAIARGDDEAASERARQHRLSGLNTMKVLLQTSGLSQV
ncbi:GntR family transcriptional regulator [uncultured Roseibium sp.]|uniref:GntR family transcriptional regulator n=1 Tax=uncultured Roseibium sp. TaxID=1936171 RepID=UPI00260C3A2C|nr:GntR family transcriptional regulator [uncultured Roseibium sp.]